MKHRPSFAPVLVLVASALAASCPQLRAQETMYKCVDEHGNTTFTNTGSTKGCTRLNVDPVVIPKLVTPNQKQSSSGAATPSGFPKVDSGTQRARDSDRRRILEDELHDKEARLSDLKREYNNGEPERQGNERNYQRYIERRDRLKEDVARAESDVASIRSELAKVP